MSVTVAEMADIEVEKLQAIVTPSTTEDDGEEMLGEELSQKHPFHWETIHRDPKGNHPSVCTRRNWYKTMTYCVLDTNGFLLLFTMRGRVYWVTQNTTTHTTPDWKLHFSIIEEDIPRAWNILAKLFMEKKCDIGMKVTTNATRFCASSQRGREITVYLYVYDPRLKSGVMYQPPSPDSEIETFIGETEDDNIENQVHLLFIDSKNPTNNVFARDHIVLDQFPSFTESDFYLGPEFEGIYSPTFWHEFIVQAEERLGKAGIRSNGGTAEGDLPLPHCRYASLRNEAFVCEDIVTAEDDHQCTDNDDAALSSQASLQQKKEKTPLQYPSNAAGWNAAKQRNPLEETVYLLLLRPPHTSYLRSASSV